MAKIMLVEDDDNLREIYGARLMAEGYDIVSAKDGEEALALAVKEKPDLIISDVMMPRISGFDMLDILRNAPETRETKVIMMTALSQAEDKSRADKLGADRYLVKSQVTLEDVANVVHEVLEGSPAEAESLPAGIIDMSATPAPTQMPVQTTEAAAVSPTVEAIANPVVEVHDEQDSSQIQSPPDSPEIVTDPTAAQAATAPSATDPAASTTQVTSDDSGLPPVVEPSPATPIKVELPQPLDTPQTEVATEQTATAPDTQADTTVGPSLAEALASEEKQKADDSQSVAATPQVEPVANGVPIPTIISPTEPPRADTTTPPAPKNIPVTADSDEPEMSGVNEISGKKVIEPLKDPLAKPDLNALMAAEEQKAAVANPQAATIIKPTDGTNASQQPPASQKSGNDDLNKIAL